MLPTPAIIPVTFMLGWPIQFGDSILLTKKVESRVNSSG